MENLYTFSKKSWHVRFFKWMWNIDATVKYKTMCPYFWQFIGSLIILPLIVTWNLILWIIAPIERWIDRKAEISAEEEMQNILFQFRQADTMKEKYILWKSKCFRKYMNGLLDMRTISDDDYRAFRLEAIRYEQQLEDKKSYEKAKRQVKVDNIKYGVIGKIALYAGTLLVLYFGVILIDWFVHLFTMNAFLEFLLILVGVLIFIVITLVIAYIIITINEKYNCDGELTKFNPFIYIVMVFIGIGKGIKIIIDMVKNLYKESCPIITWKE